MTPELLLALTFAISAGSAVSLPVFQAALPETVDREDLPQAVTLNGISFKLARAIGPAIGGFLVAATGPAAVFALNAASFLAVIGVLARWPARRVAADPIAPERAGDALRAGLRHARNAPLFRSVLIRTLAFALPASALWSLLPLVARRDPSGGPELLGLLLALIGAGSVVTGLVLPTVWSRLDDRVVLIVAAIAMVAGLVLAVGDRPPMLAAMVVAGFGWMASMGVLMVGAQMAVAPWVRGRAIAIWVMVFSFAIAIGSAAWGPVVERIWLAPALAAAGLLQVLATLAVTRFALPRAIDPSAEARTNPWPAPNVVGEVELDRGPVMITIGYEVAADRVADFRRLMHDIARARRAIGTLLWHLHALSRTLIYETGGVAAAGMAKAGRAIRSKLHERGFTRLPTHQSARAGRRSRGARGAGSSPGSGAGAMRRSRSWSL